MRTSRFYVASLGTLLIHLFIGYTLFMGSVMLPKPSVRELIVTEVSFLEAPKPTPILETLKEECIQKVEPIVEKKPEKKVLKEVVKTTPVQRAIKEPIATTHVVPATTMESVTEERVPTQVTTSSNEKASTTSSHQSDDLLSLYLAKVRHKIQESLRYPSMAKKMGLEGEAVVQFLIHANGMVDTSSIKIAKSSGKAVLDRNAIDAVIEALPFEFPPREEIEIKVPVVFKLTS
ncbi:MAG: TonB-like protein [Proteobacteria bacterium]|nr:TonB-like protein [Pseudomonadota bacterium]